MTDNSLIVANDNGREVCCLRAGRDREYGQRDDEDMANSILIAAAPDMLAACEEVMEFLSNGTPVHPGALVQASIFNAICKAKGGA